ncbi:type II toxin-antitoxin system RelE/ParE family toxin [Xanthomonas arboricola]|uniref:type II toxin-antitoxin system RelE/ParE family toxin n=1 Tax=Xanthomonas arboricola TaxID=56448 RepID=UPI0009BF907B
MARIALAPEVAQDLERIFDQLQRHEAAHVAARLHEVIAAIDVLETNPLIGRPACRRRQVRTGDRSRRARQSGAVLPCRADRHGVCAGRSLAT